MNNDRHKLLSYLLIPVLLGVAVSWPNPVWAENGTTAPQTSTDAAPYDNDDRHYPRRRYYPHPGAMITDALVIRPLSLAVTAVGTGLFVATLPFTLLGNQVDHAADALVTGPAYHTFSRCLGCFGYHRYPRYYRHRGHYRHPYYRHRGFHGHHGFRGHHGFHGHHGHR